GRSAAALERDEVLAVAQVGLRVGADLEREGAVRRVGLLQVALEWTAVRARLRAGRARRRAARDLAVDARRVGREVEPRVGEALLDQLRRLLEPAARRVASLERGIGERLDVALELLLEDRVEAGSEAGAAPTEERSDEDESVDQAPLRLSPGRDPFK